MKQSKFTAQLSSLSLALLFGATSIVPAYAADTVLKKDTTVKLKFVDSLSSKTAHEGDKVKFSVIDNVEADGTTVIKRGTPVIGTVAKVDKRKHFGVNAHIQLVMSPVRTVTGQYAPLDFKSRGEDIGSRTGTAAGASVGTAVLLGPLGLAAGYFIVGKSINAKPGDKMTVVISKDIIMESH